MIQIFHNNRLLTGAPPVKSIAAAKRHISERDNGPAEKWTRQGQKIDGVWYECHFGGPSNAYEIRVLWSEPDEA